LLFSGGQWQEDDGLLDISWASKFYCAFPIITGTLIFILSGIQIYRLTLLYHKEEDSSFLGLFMDSFLSLICCSMVLASAIFITLGFIVWCGLMNERFPSCETADGQNITKSEVKIKTTGFYNEMGTAQFGAWGKIKINLINTETHQLIYFNIFSPRHICNIRYSINICHFEAHK
jgi:hypothetical protein